MAALRGVAATGLPDRLAFPEIVGLLKEIAPFETAAMLWLGPDLIPVDTYTNMDVAPRFTSRYVERWFDREEARFYPRQRDMQLNPRLGVVRVSDHTPRFGETELYDEIYRLGGHHWIAGIALRQGGRPIGNLGIGRPPDAPDFSDAEMRALKRARAYVVQALGGAGPMEAWPELDVEDEAAMLLTDSTGRILQASSGAWRLLHGAAGAPADPVSLHDRVYEWARPMLVRLAELVIAGLTGQPAPPARLEAVTVYGRFVLRAYALEATMFAPQAFAVQIERRLPLGLKMFRSPAFRALTPREQEIARLLSTGLSYPRIGEMLGLVPATVVTHVRNLGQKLGVATREEIVQALCR